MKEGICKFCNQPARLVDSHIIPLGLYWGLNDPNGRPAKLLSPHENEYPKRQPAGFYDNFVCEKHEEQFNDYDTYACSLLRDTTPTKVINGWEFVDVKYDLIKLFFLSLLWRAHWASNDFFEKIDLGPHEKRIKQLLEDKNPSASDEYAVVLWRSEELISNAVRQPHRERYYGVSYIRFYIPGYMALIKVDKRPLYNKFASNSLKIDKKWFVERKQYEGTTEEKTMIDVYKKNRKYIMRTKR